MGGGFVWVCVCVFGCVELKHGIVSETPSCTEPPLLHHMNNWCSMCSRYCSEMKCGIVHPGMEVCYWSRWPAAYDADAPVLPLQSDALSGALHPAPAQHGSEVLGPRTQDCPRNPIKAGSRMSDPPSLLIFQKSSGGPVCVFKWLWSDMPEDRKLQCVFCFLWRECLYSPWLITNGLSLIWKYAATEVFIALN